MGDIEVLRELMGSVYVTGEQRAALGRVLEPRFERQRRLELLVHELVATEDEVLRAAMAELPVQQQWRLKRILTGQSNRLGCVYLHCELERGRSGLHRKGPESWPDVAEAGKHEAADNAVEEDRRHALLGPCGAE